MLLIYSRCPTSELPVWAGLKFMSCLATCQVMWILAPPTLEVSRCGTWLESMSLCWVWCSIWSLFNHQSMENEYRIVLYLITTCLALYWFYVWERRGTHIHVGCEWEGGDPFIIGCEWCSISILSHVYRSQGWRMVELRLIVRMKEQATGMYQVDFYPFYRQTILLFLCIAYWRSLLRCFTVCVHFRICSPEMLQLCNIVYYLYVYNPMWWS